MHCCNRDDRMLIWHDGESINAIIIVTMLIIIASLMIMIVNSFIAFLNGWLPFQCYGWEGLVCLAWMFSPHGGAKLSFSCLHCHVPIYIMSILSCPHQPMSHYHVHLKPCTKIPKSQTIYSFCHCPSIVEGIPSNHSWIRSYIILWTSIFKIHDHDY